jgi:kanamycin kinase
MNSVEPPVPVPVQTIAQDRRIRLVWRNPEGGLTYELGAASERCFVKWAPRGAPIDLSREAARFTWASAFIPVPRVLEQGVDGDGSWMVTTPVPGESAVSPRWSADPARAVTAIGRGLRALHDALPVERCPFACSAEDQVRAIRRADAGGRLDPADWDEVHRHLGVGRALDLLSAIPPIDRLVVCHGDACAPNTLIGSDGVFSGHVDLGSMGVADRWADLAVATWSAGWNYGTDWEQPLLAAYGIVLDLERTRYYRLLYDLAPRQAPSERHSPRTR